MDWDREKKGATVRDIYIPADLIPKRVLVEKSTVQLLVGGVWWNEPAPQPEIKEAA